MGTLCGASGGYAAEPAALSQALAEHPLVGEARGVGLIGGLELVRDKRARQSFEPRLRFLMSQLPPCSRGGTVRAPSRRTLSAASLPSSSVPTSAPSASGGYATGGSVSAAGGVLEHENRIERFGVARLPQLACDFGIAMVPRSYFERRAKGLILKDFLDDPRQFTQTIFVAQREA